MRCYLAALAAVVAGCASNPASMSADQLNALAKDKNASITCSKVIAAGVTATLVLINVDEVARPNTAASVTADCVANVVTDTPQRFQPANAGGAVGPAVPK